MLCLWILGRLCWICAGFPKSVTHAESSGISVCYSSLYSVCNFTKIALSKTNFKHCISGRYLGRCGKMIN